MEQNSPVVLLCYRQIPKSLELQMEILSAYRLGLAKFQAIFWTEKKNTRTNETCFINSWKCDES